MTATAERRHPELPDVLTGPEVAAVLRVSPAHIARHLNGADGIQWTA